MGPPPNPWDEICITHTARSAKVDHCLVVCFFFLSRRRRRSLLRSVARLARTTAQETGRAETRNEDETLVARWVHTRCNFFISNFPLYASMPCLIHIVMRLHQFHIRQENRNRLMLIDAPGLMDFVPALAYHFCVNLPSAFTQPGASTNKMRLIIDDTLCFICP